MVFFFKHFFPVARKCIILCLCILSDSLIWNNRFSLSICFINSSNSFVSLNAYYFNLSYHNIYNNTVKNENYYYIICLNYLKNVLMLKLLFFILSYCLRCIELKTYILPKTSSMLKGELPKCIVYIYNYKCIYVGKAISV